MPAEMGGVRVEIGDRTRITGIGLGQGVEWDRAKVSCLKLP